MMAKFFRGRPVAQATNQGYDPYLALCVARIKRAQRDRDLDFFGSALYEIMFNYCALCVPGLFAPEVHLVLPNGVTINERNVANGCAAN